MRSASCGFENPDGMEFLQPCPPVSTASPLPARAPTLSSYTPQHLAVKLLTSPSALEGQRKQVTADPEVMEERR
ncbi:MAG: hypothetical protein ACRERE_41880 [Candidatus Entotheonellia bacterium]